MDLDVKGKVVIVTGGASGIGESIACKLAAEGAIVCIIDRNEQGMAAVAQKIEAEGGLVFCSYAELTDFKSCKESVERILERFGKINGLVNNAGVNDGVGLEDGDPVRFYDSLARNAGHYYAMTKLLLPALKQSKGKIVNICSKVAETGQGGTSGYAAANGARLGLTVDWAAELEPYGINVNAVVVAECMTPLYEWWLNRQPNPEEKLRQIIAKIPFESRMTTTGEIASTAIFLLSPRSNAINGQIVHVDG